MRCSFGTCIAAFAALARGAADDPCASPANAVVAENCKQGVSSDVWDVNGAGSPGVRGFATQASVLPGEVVEFKDDPLIWRSIDNLYILKILD